MSKITPKLWQEVFGSLSTDRQDALKEIDHSEAIIINDKLNKKRRDSNL